MVIAEILCLIQGETVVISEIFFQIQGERCDDILDILSIPGRIDGAI